MPNVLLLARQLEGADGTWPLLPLLDRLEARGLSAQIACLARGMARSDDRRAIEAPQLANRWLRSLAVRRLWSDVRGFRPRLIHALDDPMASVALALSEIGQVPYIQSVNSFSTLETGLTLSQRWCRGIVAASHDLADDLTSALGVPAELITVVRPGIVEPKLASPENDTKCVPVVGTAGSIEDLVSFTILLEAARLVLDAGHEVEFVIATEETEHVYLRHRARKLGVAERVTVSDHPLIGPSFWSLFNVYCQPSVGPCSGRTLLYAMAHGIPSIASDVKGLRSLIEPGETALLIPPDDPHALKQAIIDLISAPDDARRLGWQGRASIRARFDPDVEADKLAALFSEVANET